LHSAHHVPVSRVRTLFGARGNLVSRYCSRVLPQRRQTRSLLPSGRTLCPRRAPLLHAGQNSKTLEIEIAPSFSTIPPFTFFDGLGRVWRLIMPACSTVTVRFPGFTARTRPVLPRSRPVITRT